MQPDEISFEALPLWDPADPPGPFDLIAGTSDTPRLAAEVKWASRNTLSHSLWDVLKLLGVLALGADQVYMVAGFPEKIWRSSEFAPLYTTGTVRYTGLPLAKEWPSLISESKGTPL